MIDSVVICLFQIKHMDSWYVYVGVRKNLIIKYNSFLNAQFFSLEKKVHVPNNMSVW